MNWKQWSLIAFLCIFFGFLGYGGSCIKLPQPSPDFIKPFIHIKAEKVVPLGSLAIATVDIKENGPIKSLQYKWVILKNGKTIEFTEWPDGSKVFWGVGLEKVRYDLVLSVTYEYKDNTEKRGLDLVTTNLFVGDPSPPDPPDPTPEPDFNVGRYDLAKFSYREAMKIERGRQGAGPLSNSFKGIASAIAAGAIKTPEEALKQCKESNNKALVDANVSLDAWENFSIALQDKLYQFYKDKKINVVGDYKDAFLEIADGLAKVK